MKVSFLIVMLFLFLSACNNNARLRDEKSNIDLDTIVFEVEIEESPAVTFRDFSCGFSSDEQYQKDHVKLPLPYNHAFSSDYQYLTSWDVRNYGFGMESSTLLFCDSTINESREYFRLDSDSTAHISLFHLDDKKWNRWRDGDDDSSLFIWNYSFANIKSKWMLNGISVMPVHENKNESFFEYVTAICASDSVWLSRIHPQATLTYYDEVEDKNRSLRFLDFKYCHIIDDYIYKEIFVEIFNSQSDLVTTYTKGEDAGYHLERYYKRIDGLWYLVKEVNLGI